MNSYSHITFVVKTDAKIVQLLLNADTFGLGFFTDLILLFTPVLLWLFFVFLFVCVFFFVVLLRLYLSPFRKDCSKAKASY